MKKKPVKHTRAHVRESGNRHACLDVTVEQLLVWTYHRQLAAEAERASSRAGAPVQSSSSVVLHRFSRLGCAVDVSGPDIGRLHEDAEVVHDVVSRLGGVAKGLVVQHARRGDRPDWGEGLVTRVVPDWKDGPRYDASGKPARRAYHKIYDGNRHCIGCCVVIENHPDRIAVMRRDYRTWWDALVWVRSSLSDRPDCLVKHRVVGLGPPAFPWNVEATVCQEAGNLS